VNFICPTGLIEIDVKFHTKWIKIDQPDSDGPLIIFQPDYRELIGQNVMNVQQTMWYIVRQRDVLSHVSSPDFYAQTPQGICLSDLFPEREIVNIIGVSSSPEELVVYAFTYDISTIEEQEQEWENKHGNLDEFEFKEDIILEQIVVSYSDKGFTFKGDKVSRKIPHPESTTIPFEEEELQLWLENFLIKERQCCSA